MNELLNLENQKTVDDMMPLVNAGVITEDQIEIQEIADEDDLWLFEADS